MFYQKRFKFAVRPVQWRDQQHWQSFLEKRAQNLVWAILKWHFFLPLRSLPMTEMRDIFA